MWSGIVEDPEGRDRRDGMLIQVGQVGQAESPSQSADSDSCAVASFQAHGATVGEPRSVLAGRRIVALTAIARRLFGRFCTNFISTKAVRIGT